MIYEFAYGRFVDASDFTRSLFGLGSQSGDGQEHRNVDHPLTGSSYTSLMFRGRETDELSQSAFAIPNNAIRKLKMLLTNNLFVTFILLTFAAIAWVLIRYPAEKELKNWHAQQEQNRKFGRISALDFYRTSPPSTPTRKSSVGFFISIAFLIGSLFSACEAIF